jgi:serine O-acetyltransferase
MKEKIKKIFQAFLIWFGYIRFFPHVFLSKVHPNRNLIREDVVNWIKLIRKDLGFYDGFVYLLTFTPEYRNLFYKRVGMFRYLIEWYSPKLNSLYLYTTNIGGGLFFMHGFSTVVSAKSIGKNCHIYQQVTIGYSGLGKSPVILDNVVISSGAKVIGNITVGNNVVVGANAVVVKNVPDNCTVVGVPAYIVRRNGHPVREEL